MPERAPTHLALVRRSKIGQESARSARAEYDRQRGPDRQFYGTTRWRKFRAWFLVRNPVCCECNDAASEVDHILGRRERPDLAFDAGNCRAMCKSCHSRRTAKDQGFARPT